MPLEAKEFSRISAFRVATSPETYIVHFFEDGAQIPADF